ncbi:MAG: transposase, partial [Pyrinomonadaceae bacterium]
MKVGLSSLSSTSLFDSQLHCLTFYRRKGGPSMSTTFVGLDLGSSRCQLTVLDADGTLRFSRAVPTGEQPLRAAFVALGADVRVHLEAGELAAWTRSILAPLVSEVVVSHPRTLAWIAKDSNKTDAIDARKLADLLRLNLVHPVYYENSDDRCTFKHLVTHYEQLSAEQARLKAKIKARLRTLGIIRKDARVFSSSGNTALLELITEPAIKQMLTQSFAVLRQMIESLEDAKQAMVAAAAKFPEVRLLQTAPGVGIVTACRFVGYVQT